MALPYPISAAQVLPNKPVDTTLMDAIRLDLEDHEGRIGSNESISSNDIRDDFKGATLDLNLWDLTTAATPPVASIGGSSYQHTMSLIADSNGDLALLTGDDTKIRWNITQERVVVMEFRIRGIGVGGNRASFVGAQDTAIGALGPNYLLDVTDCLGVYIKNVGFWTIRSAINPTSSESVDVVASNAWHTFKFVITCSATAGSRSIDVYLDGDLAAISPITTNLATNGLLPCAGSYVNGAASSNEINIDYFLCYDQDRPEAA